MIEKEIEKVQGDICPSCNKIHGVRKDLNKICSSEDLQILKMIDSKMRAAIDTTNPVNFGAGTTKEQASIVMDVAFDFRAKATLEKEAWWEAAKNKYTLPEALPGLNLSIDFKTGDFYIYEEFEKTKQD